MSVYTTTILQSIFHHFITFIHLFAIVQFHDDTTKPVWGQKTRDTTFDDFHQIACSDDSTTVKPALKINQCEAAKIFVGGFGNFDDEMGRWNVHYRMISGSTLSINPSIKLLATRFRDNELIR